MLVVESESIPAPPLLISILPPILLAPIHLLIVFSHLGSSDYQYLRQEIFRQESPSR